LDNELYHVNGLQQLQSEVNKYNDHKTEWSCALVKSHGLTRKHAATKAKRDTAPFYTKHIDTVEQWNIIPSVQPSVTSENKYSAKDVSSILV